MKNKKKLYASSKSKLKKRIAISSPKGENSPNNPKRKEKKERKKVLVLPF